MPVVPYVLSELEIAGFCHPRPEPGAMKRPCGGNGYVLPLRTSRCSSKRRRFASNRRSALSASHVSAPAALKRIMRPFCCCTMRRPSATSSSARRRSFSESIYQNNVQTAKTGAGPIFVATPAPANYNSKVSSRGVLRRISPSCRSFWAGRSIRLRTWTELVRCISDFDGRSRGILRFVTRGRRRYALLYGRCRFDLGTAAGRKCFRTNHPRAPPTIGATKDADIKAEYLEALSYKPCPANVRFPNGQ